jgi:hypothetical protein
MSRKKMILREQQQQMCFDRGVEEEEGRLLGSYPSYY